MRKLAKCGIAILDAPTDVFGSVATYRPRSEQRKPRPQVVEDTMKVRPHVRYFHSSRQHRPASARFLALTEWRRKQHGPRCGCGEAGAREVRIQVARSIFDMLAIPADAPHPGMRAFLNYLMEPRLSRRSRTRALRERQHRIAKYVDDSIKNDLGIYRDAATRRLHPDMVESQQFSRDLNRS
jgi:hypothetical protein